MLEFVEIKGFRSFSQESTHRIELQPFTVIVGENDTGKSNLLKAIQLALDPSVGKIAREDFNIRKSLSTGGKIVDKKAPQISIKLHFKNSMRLLPKQFQKRSFNTKSDELFIITCTASGHDKKSYKKEYKLNNKTVQNYGVPKLLSKIKCFITPSIRDVNYLSGLKEMLPVERSSRITQAVKRFNDIVKGKLKREEALFKRAIEAQKVSIDPVLDSEKVLEIMDFDFSIIKDDIPIQLKNHGQGMVSKIIISLFLKRGASNIIGIEEPEIHIHPNLIREIVFECEKQVKKRTQVIIVTHSHYLINFIPVENILIARKDKKYTKINKIIPLDRDIVKKIENNIFLNRQKTEILFAKGVIFVEGPYDRLSLMAIDINDKTLSFCRSVSIIDVGGDAFLPYIELCVNSGIPWAVIADSKAFYSPENNKRGPLLKTIERYVPEDHILRLQNKIMNRKSARNEMRTINELLRIKKGYIAYLSGGDILETIVNILIKKADLNLYKSLFVKYGGFEGEQDHLRIKSTVEATILNKGEQMKAVDAVQMLKKPHELEHAFKSALNQLIRLSGNK